MDGWIDGRKDGGGATEGEKGGNGEQMAESGARENWGWGWPAVERVGLDKVGV